MNTQLSEALRVWKAGEFERHVRRYIAMNHNPSAPENQIRLREAFAKPAPRPVGLKEGEQVLGPTRIKSTFSWNAWNAAMGVKAA